MELDIQSPNYLFFFTEVLRNRYRKKDSEWLSVKSLHRKIQFVSSSHPLWLHHCSIITVLQSSLQNFTFTGKCWNWKRSWGVQRVNMWDFSVTSSRSYCQVLYTRMAGNFRGMPIFVIFVVHSAVTKFHWQKLNINMYGRQTNKGCGQILWLHGQSFWVTSCVLCCHCHPANGTFDPS